jgi:hypothetical protein
MMDVTEVKIILITEIIIKYRHYRESRYITTEVVIHDTIMVDYSCYHRNVDASITILDSVIEDKGFALEIVGFRRNRNSPEIRRHDIMGNRILTRSFVGSYGYSAVIVIRYLVHRDTIPMGFVQPNPFTAAVPAVIVCGVFLKGIIIGCHQFNPGVVITVHMIPCKSVIIGL